MRRYSICRRAEDLIRIPLAVSTGECRTGQNDNLISLMDINDIMMSLLNNKEYVVTDKSYIKIGRSAIYNRDFAELYDAMGSEYKGEAFEGFIFDDGYKLIIFSNGHMELFSIEDDTEIKNNTVINEKYNLIKDEVTCCISEARL